MWISYFILVNQIAWVILGVIDQIRFPFMKGVDINIIEVILSWIIVYLKIHIGKS